MMKNANHTPGPWSLGTIDGDFIEIDAKEGKHSHLALATVVWRMEEDERSPRCEANARLIAAAPELLVALEQQLYFLNLLAGTIPLSEEPTHRRIKGQQSELRAAIAKATGGE